MIDAPVRRPPVETPGVAAAEPETVRVEEAAAPQATEAPAPEGAAPEVAAPEIAVPELAAPADATAESQLETAAVASKSAPGPSESRGDAAPIERAPVALTTDGPSVAPPHPGLPARPALVVDEPLPQSDQAQAPAT